jgi:hypothetical protein
MFSFVYFAFFSSFLCGGVGGSGQKGQPGGRAPGAGADGAQVHSLHPLALRLHGCKCHVLCTVSHVCASTYCGVRAAATCVDLIGRSFIQFASFLLQLIPEKETPKLVNAVLKYQVKNILQG